MSNDINFMPIEEMGKGINIKFEIVDTEEDGYYDFARVLLNEIKSNNSKNKNTLVVVPVGPIEQFPKIIRLINLENIDCSKFFIISIDEYCTDDGKDFIAYSHKFSYRRFLDENVYSKIRSDLNMKKENILFPDPKNPSLLAEKIKQIGGIDICFAGVGFNGHIGLNEPPEAGNNISVEEFRNLPSRVIDLARESIVQNAFHVSGNIDLVPKKAITVGMKELFAAKKVYFNFSRDWQSTIIRKVIHGPVTPKVPCSLFQQHPDVTIVASRNAVTIKSDL